MHDSASPFDEYNGVRLRRLMGPLPFVMSSRQLSFFEMVTRDSSSVTSFYVIIDLSVT